MKKVILFFFFVFFVKNIYSQKIKVFSVESYERDLVKGDEVKMYDDNNHLVYSIFGIKHFKFNGTYYPIVDSVTRRYYGDEKYAKSFGHFIPIDTVVKTEFSQFLLERQKVPYFTYLHNGYNQSEQIKQKPIEKKKVYFEFVLFFILLPILIYMINEPLGIGKYDSYYVKENFSFLAGSLLFALAFKVILFDFIPNFLKLDYDQIINFFGSHTLYTFVSYVLILSLLVSFFGDLEEFFFRDIPIIIFTGIIAAILSGLSFGEIYSDSVMWILVVCSSSLFVISFFVEVVFSYFYEKYKERQERLKSKLKELETTGVEEKG